MDPFKTPGAFSWCELMTSDPDAAARFYSALFGWTLETMPDAGMPYQVIKTGTDAIGGVMGLPPGAPPGMPPTWAAYVTVADIEAVVKQVTALGGSVMMPPTDIPSVGRFAVIQDPQGAMLNVIEYLATAD